MIPRIIHQTSPTLTLRPEERRLRKRLLGKLQGWELRHWDDAANDCLFRRVYPDLVGKWNKISNGILKADISRYLYLHCYGGWYFDTDYWLIRPPASELLEAACILPVSGGAGDLHFVCNSVLASRPGYPLWSEFIEVLFSSIDLSAVGEESVEKTTGPLGLSQFYRQNCTSYPEICFPAKTVFHPEIVHFGFHYKGDARTCGVHWCWGSWKSKNSIRRLKNRLVRWWTSTMYN